MLASNPSSVPAIACQGIVTTRLTALGQPILDRVNLTIAPGEFVVLLGLNGAGKSTLLRTLVGLTPISQGQIQIQGMPLTPATLPQVRRQIGMLCQGGGLVRQLPALENVLCGYLGRRSTWQTLTGFCKADRRAALDLLANLGLKELAYQKTAHLSGGQQQRVAIARALLQSPRILLADEPVTGLDVVATRQVMETLTRLHQDGMTIVTVLHDLELARAYGERAIVLEAGQVYYDGPIRHLPTHCFESARSAA